MAGGLAVGALAWFIPEVAGVGYSHVSETLNGRMVLQLMAMLVLLKIGTVALSYASGNAGGIFGPSLFIGAMLGGVMGSVAQQVMPLSTGPVGAYALVGMGAVFAGIIRTPMTSVIMIFEITRDYAIIVPLMIANLLSFFISRRYQPQQIYEALARQEGVHLPSSESRELQAKYRVSIAMRSEGPVVKASISMEEAAEKAKKSRASAMLVMDTQGLLGVIKNSEIYRAAESSPKQTLQSFLSPQEFPHVHEDQSLVIALERMGASGLDVLPVVSRINVRQLEGVLFLSDVMQTFGLQQ